MGWWWEICRLRGEASFWLQPKSLKSLVSDSRSFFVQFYSLRVHSSIFEFHDHLTTFKWSESVDAHRSRRRKVDCLRVVHFIAETKERYIAGDGVLFVCVPNCVLAVQGILGKLWFLLKIWSFAQYPALDLASSHMMGRNSTWGYAQFARARLHDGCFWCVTPLHISKPVSVMIRARGW